VETSQTKKTEIVSLNALYRSGKSLMQLQKGPEDAQTVLVELEKLKTSRFQKRVVTPERVKQLAETIRNNGLLQPVTARQVGDELELIAGHRRREAFRLLHSEAASDEERAKWSRIPCIIRMGLTDVQAAALSAVENLERDDGDPLEQGLSLLEVKKVGGFTTNAQVAEATGMSAQRVARLIRLAESPDIIQQAVTPGLLVELTDGEGVVRKERRTMELTVALAAFGYYRHHERAEDAESAKERTEKLLLRALKGGWTRAKLESEVKRLTRVGEHAELHEPGDEPGPTDPDNEQREDEAPKRLLFRDKGVLFTVYRRNLSRAELTDLHALMVRLRAVVSEVEAQITVSEARNHP
jgi:ParB/RepB/Spo0J family partition protein